MFKIVYQNTPEKSEILLNISDVYKYLKKYDIALKYIDIYQESTDPHGGTYCARIDVNSGTQANCDFDN